MILQILLLMWSNLFIAQAASADGVKVFKFSRWRNKGTTLPEVMDAYRSVEAELNVLPFCTQFIPMDVINHPKHQSICYHPSLLPKHRGASSINWSVFQCSIEEEEDDEEDEMMIMKKMMMLMKM